MGRGIGFSEEQKAEIQAAYADSETSAEFIKKHPTGQSRAIQRAWKKLSVEGNLDRKSGSGRKRSYTAAQHMCKWAHNHGELFITHGENLVRVVQHCVACAHALPHDELAPVISHGSPFAGKVYTAW